MSTVFTGIELGPPIEVFALSKAFQDDTHEPKVNLTIGGKDFSIFKKHIFVC
jgi:aspartate aminotransferase